MQQRIGKYRWTICALIFFATTINYLDRTVLGLLKPLLEKKFKWSESDYANLVATFQFTYAIGLLLSGWLIDKIGTKVGYALSLLFWSFSAMAHALVKNFTGFIVARSALGLSESGNFPSAIKTVAEWFPKKERALATGIFNSGTSIGNIIAPFFVFAITEKYGWQGAFIATGSVGLIWLVFWISLYQVPSKQKKLSKEEFDYIHSDIDESTQNVEPRIAWRKILRYKQTWAIALGKFLTDPVWWFYMFWTPSFLFAQYKISGSSINWPFAVIYIMAIIGSIFGGWLPLNLIQNGWQVFRARKTSMFIYALFALPVVLAQFVGSINMWYAVIIIGLAAAAHQAWSANIYTTASDMFPKKAVGSVTGIGGMAGALGGILISLFAGFLFDHYKALGKIETGYYIMFIICGCAYVFAWIVMHLLVPKMQRVNV